MTQESARIIKTDCFGIVVTLEGKGGGTITSDLHELGDEPGSGKSVARDLLYDAAIDGLEAMILAQAVAGVDITDPAYLSGVETAVQTIAVRF